MASGHVSMKYRFQGPNHAAVTACATGAHSIGDAMRMIQIGDADVMVAGGTESSIDALSIKLHAPFDSGKDGLCEGSGVLILEDLEHAKRREAKFYVEVRGYGMSSHAHHITQPHIDGRGAIFGHGTCLETIWSHPNQVDYVNAQLRLHLWVMQLKQMQSNPYSLTMQHLVLWSSPQQRWVCVVVGGWGKKRGSELGEKDKVYVAFSSAGHATALYFMK
ncbi:synthase [Hibiscus syriacus]|uniref:beta-ketoacyl-[acyl-carrier-protein] synthase I n=1 Tax=Hibiscus syriacus TaxID=106335 RepID=A0A6A2WCQ7_HIBSY|nr:synthase [Hibiscus syriacus]